MSIMKEVINTENQYLNSVIKRMKNNIKKIWSFLEPFLLKVNDNNFLLWLVGITVILLAFLPSFLFIIGFICNILHWNTCYSGILVVGSAVSLCNTVFTILLIIQLLIVGHAYLFICKPIYGPDFTFLSKVLDKPSLIIPTDVQYQIFGEQLHISEPDHQAFNISTTELINSCEDGKSGYTAFNVENIFNINNLSNYRSYPSLFNKLEEIQAPNLLFLTFTDKLQFSLENIITDISMNLTSYRLGLVQMSPEKDLNMFIDQLERVSLQVGSFLIWSFYNSTNCNLRFFSHLKKFQIQDSSTKSRMTSLSNKVKRLQVSLLNPLERLLFHLTALEIQVGTDEGKEKHEFNFFSYLGETLESRS